ncbi:hypothetical protein D4764_0192250 [Takifugu flavidus]|uniref:Reverse transcriptase zinc-binding domain-containing protein n=1 Tax=Takifugu flavidus TaxID=433684 RepID=A0A5C6MGM2_9TELE|nr:hypothetical protein D4764_0192250 [Takifugu flavidus]
MLTDDRRDEAELHFDLTSSWESGGVSPCLDMSAFTRVKSLRTSTMHSTFSLGRKWKAEKTVDVARLRQKALVGAVATGRTGLGYFPKTQVSLARGKERHHLLQEEVRAGVEEERVGRAVGLPQQGAWTRWESALQRKVTWSNIMQADFHHVRFLVAAVYNALPSPANLHAWGKCETPTCSLCSGRGSLEHLLSRCPKSWPMVAIAGATTMYSKQWLRA